MKPLYIINGKIEDGHKRGKNLGFPTANSQYEKAIPEGIYATNVVVDGKSYDAATFVGAAITFGEEVKKIESYLFEFNNDIYGKIVKILFFKKIRSNKKFSTKEELILQMKQDEKDIKTFFSLKKLSTHTQ